MSSFTSYYLWRLENGEDLMVGWGISPGVGGMIDDILHLEM